MSIIIIRPIIVVQWDAIAVIIRPISLGLLIQLWKYLDIGQQHSDNSDEVYILVGHGRYIQYPYGSCVLWLILWKVVKLLLLSFIPNQPNYNNIYRFVVDSLLRTGCKGQKKTENKQSNLQLCRSFFVFFWVFSYYYYKLTGHKRCTQKRNKNKCAIKAKLQNEIARLRNINKLSPYK